MDPASDSSSSSDGESSSTASLTLDLRPDDDMTTVSSVASGEASPSSPLVYFCPKDVGRVVRLPHLTSDLVWSDGAIRDVGVQTVVAAGVHRGVQTEPSVLEDFADRTATRLLIEAMLVIFLRRRRDWESTEELTEPLDASYDSGIEESRATTLVKGSPQERLWTIGEDQLSEGLAVAAALVGGQRESSKALLGEEQRTVGEDHLSDVHSANDTFTELRDKPAKDLPEEPLNETEELVTESHRASPLQVDIEPNEDLLEKAMTDDGSFKVLPEEKEVVSDKPIAQPAQESAQPAQESPRTPRFRIQDLDDYVVTMSNGSDTDATLSSNESQDPTCLPARIRDGLSITDVSHIPGLPETSSVPLVLLPSEPCPSSRKDRSTVLFDEVTVTDYDVQPRATEVRKVQGATVMSLDECSVTDYDVNLSPRQEEVDHLKQVEEDIIRSLQQRCAPSSEYSPPDSVGQWLTACVGPRGGLHQLSPVPEETEEDSASSVQSSSQRTSLASRESSATRTSETEESPAEEDQQRSRHRKRKPDPFVDELKERLRVRRRILDEAEAEVCWETKEAVKGAVADGVWSPGAESRPSDAPASNATFAATSSSNQSASTQEGSVSRPSPSDNKENMSPVWQPFGGEPDEKPQFRSVKVASPLSQRRDGPPPLLSPPSRPLVCSDNSSGQRTPGSPLSPGGSSRIGVSSGLLQYQNPTITLLQKAREGQLPKGAIYINQNSKEDIPADAVLVDQQVTVEGDRIHTDSYYALPTSQMVGSGNTKVIKAPAKHEGIGPTERGIPISLRTGVKEEFASDWYKSMYKSLHKFDKMETGRAPHSGGYMSEPEFERDDDYPYSSRYATMDPRRRPPPEKISYVDRYGNVGAGKDPTRIYSNTFQPSHACPEVYRNQPRSIAEYEPGRSSIAEREARMRTSRYLPPMDTPRLSYIDGYESDTTLIRKTGSKPRPMDPEQQKAWYREVQRGGDIPFSGLGKPAPERPKLSAVGPPPLPLPSYSEEQQLLASLERDQVSPHRYQEGEVNIHFRTPVRNLEKEFIEEETLRKRQEAAMRKFYEEERYKKQLQQMQEIEMRRHSDNFTPSQKSPIPLNRYDNPFELPRTPPPKTPEPRSLARALFNFKAQTSRELSLNKGDIVYILKKVDRNWYEGEHHGMNGIFPVTYVEVIPAENAGMQPRKASEGQARAKYSFRAQTPLELSLFKGELVILTRRVDNNWYEGRIGAKKGIFPASYVDVSAEPGDSALNNPHSKKSPKMNGTHNVRLPYRATREAFSSYPATSQSTSRSDTTSMSSQDDKKQPIMETLHVDTYSEPIPYRALYSYRPQNDDELELKDGDTIYVMEKCDDGWYVGTSLRSGLFGTFPGNYVERI